MRTAPNILPTLRRVPFLADLDPSDLEVLSERMARRPFLRGQTIFAEGDRCDGLYLVESGTVRVVKTSQQGREQLLSLERMGGALGEIALLDGGPHPASAIADSDGAMLILPAPDLRALMQSHPQVALAMIKAVTRRFRRILRLVEELSFSTVRKRLAAHLVELARERGRRVADGIEFELRERNQELAMRIGTVRELVSRTLGRFHGEGLLRMQGRKVTIPDLGALKEEAQA